MDEWTAKQLVAALAEIYASSARIEAMKANDRDVSMSNRGTFYTEGAYLVEASYLAKFADHVRNL